MDAVERLTELLHGLTGNEYWRLRRAFHVIRSLRGKVRRAPDIHGEVHCVVHLIFSINGFLHKFKNDSNRHKIDEHFQKLIDMLLLN